MESKQKKQKKRTYNFYSSHFYLKSGILRILFVWHKNKWLNWNVKEWGKIDGTLQQWGDACCERTTNEMALIRRYIIPRDWIYNWIKVLLFIADRFLFLLENRIFIYYICMCMCVYVYTDNNERTKTEMESTAEIGT